MSRSPDSYGIVVLVAGLLAVAAPTAAQPVGIAPGDTVRVTGALRPPARGVVVAIDERELQLAVAGRTDVIAIGPNTRIAVRRGKRPLGPVMGALLGTSAAVALGLAWEASDSHERRGCEMVDRSLDGRPIYRCDKDARNMDQAWLATGAVLGLAAGYGIRVPRWLEASPALHAGVSPSGAVSVSVRLSSPAR